MVHSSQPSGRVLAVLSLAGFMAALDVFIVNVAFDAIGGDFPGTSLSALSWVLNAYAVGYAALLVPAGRLADRWGRKGAFLIGLGIFTGASAVCASSPNIWWLVTFRAVQALGAALLTPASLGLVVAAAGPERRVRWVRIWAGLGALAAVLGPVAGGLLVHVSWRLVFLVNIPVGVLAIAAAAAWVPWSNPVSHGPTPDFLGAGLLATAIGALTLAITQGPTWGWAAPRTGLAWGAAVAGLLGFLATSARHASPVVDPALLRVRSFAWGNVAAIAFCIPFAATLLTNILWTQHVWGYSSIRTGLAVAPGPAMVPLLAVLTHRYLSRVPIGTLVSLGCAFWALGSSVILLRVGATPHYATDLLPGLIINGVGAGLALPNILAGATKDLPAAQSATGSAVVNTGRQIGFALGVSLVVAVLGTPVGYPAAHTAFQHTWGVSAAVAAVAALLATGMNPRRVTAAAVVAEPVLVPR